MTSSSKPRILRSCSSWSFKVLNVNGPIARELSLDELMHDDIYISKNNTDIDIKWTNVQTN